LIALVADSFVTALMLGAGSMLTVVTGELATRRRWVGYILLLLAIAAIDARSVLDNPLDGSISILIAAIPVLAIPSGGLLALVAARLPSSSAPCSPSAWTGRTVHRTVLIPAGTLAALIIFAARSACAGRAAAL
jgi:hypothetical protein